jgi:hypothetical protein
MITHQIVLECKLVNQSHQNTRIINPVKTKELAIIHILRCLIIFSYTAIA